MTDVNDIFRDKKQLPTQAFLILTTLLYSLQQREVEFCER